MRGSWRSKPGSMRRSNPPGFIKPGGGCGCECARLRLNSLANDGPCGGAVGKPRSNCHAEGDKLTRSRVQNHARGLIHPLKKGFTFPAYAPHVRLDYIFLPAAFADRPKVCEVMQGSASSIQASDHFPLLAQLEVF